MGTKWLRRWRMTIVMATIRMIVKAAQPRKTARRVRFRRVQLDSFSGSLVEPTAEELVTGNEPSKELGKVRGQLLSDCPHVGNHSWKDPMKTEPNCRSPMKLLSSICKDIDSPSIETFHTWRQSLSKVIASSMQVSSATVFAKISMRNSYPWYVVTL